MTPPIYVPLITGYISALEITSSFIITSITGARNGSELVVKCIA